MTTIFGKIIRREVPAEIVFENKTIIVFKDIRPAAPVHLLIVPKKEIKNIQSLSKEDFNLLDEVVSIAQLLAVQFSIADGYRLLTNNGPLAGQTVEHLHFHLIGGKKLGAVA